MNLRQRISNLESEHQRAVEFDDLLDREIEISPSVAAAIARAKSEGWKPRWTGGPYDQRKYEA